MYPLTQITEHRTLLYWDTELECPYRGVYDVPALSPPFSKFDELHNSRPPRLFPTARQHIARRRYAFQAQTLPFNQFELRTLR